MPPTDTWTRVAPMRSGTGPETGGMVPMKKMVIALAVLASIAAFSAASTAGFSGKGNGGGKGGGGVTLSSGLPIQLNQDPSTVALGSTVTFSYNVDARIKTPEITVQCAQNGTNVYGDTQLAAGNSFILGSDFWSPWKVAGGAANCIATVFYFNTQDAVVTLGSTDFYAKG